MPSVRQHGSFCRNPVPIVPITETMSATTADAVSIPPAPGPFERDLADRVALQHHGVERALHGGQRVVPVDEGRMDANVDLAVDQARAADEPHDHLELVGRLDVERG